MSVDFGSFFVGLISGTFLDIYFKPNHQQARDLEKALATVEIAAVRSFRSAQYDEFDGPVGEYSAKKINDLLDTIFSLTHTPTVPGKSSPDAMKQASYALEDAINRGVKIIENERVRRFNIASHQATVFGPLLGNLYTDIDNEEMDAMVETHRQNVIKILELFQSRERYDYKFPFRKLYSMSETLGIKGEEWFLTRKIIDNNLASFYPYTGLLDAIGRIL